MVLTVTIVTTGVSKSILYGILKITTLKGVLFQGQFLKEKKYIFDEINCSLLQDFS